MTNVPMKYLELSHIFSQFFNRESAIKYFLQTYFPSGKTCEVHQRLCSVVLRAGGRSVFQCAEGRHQISLLHGTSLQGSRINLQCILKLLFCYYIHTTQRQCSMISGVCLRTISDYYCLANSAMASLSFDRFEQIGGPGITVQVDECILRRRKYQKGRRKQQIWVFGAVEMKDAGGLGRSVITRLPDRSATSLWNAIRNCIAIGSRIWSDEWRGYSCLDRSPDYVHNTVNHSIEFMDHTTGVHTNGIESLWHQLRSFLPRNGVRSKVIDQYLGSFNGFKDLKLSFDEFLRAVLDYHFDDREDQTLPPVSEEGIDDVPIVGAILDEDEESDPYGVTDGTEEPEFSFES